MGKNWVVRGIVVQHVVMYFEVLGDEVVELRGNLRTNPIVSLLIGSMTIQFVNKLSVK
jgi:hypothetical protein